MRVRDGVDEACLEHAEAAGRPNRAVRVSEPDRADATLPPAPDSPGAKRGDERCGEEGERPGAVVDEVRVLSRRADVIGGGRARQPGGVLSQPQRSLAALIITEQRQRGQKDGARQHEVLRSRIERLQPEPEMDAEAAVSPDDQQQNRLHDAERGRVHPETQQFLRISLLDPELAERDAGADHVTGQQERNGEAKDELGRLEPGPAEPAPLIERPEAEAHVRQSRKIQDRRAGRRLPDRLLDDKTPLHRVYGDVAERVIGEVQRHIEVKDEAG